MGLDIGLLLDSRGATRSSGAVPGASRARLFGVELDNPPRGVPCSVFPHECCRYPFMAVLAPSCHRPAAGAAQARVAGEPRAPKEGPHGPPGQRLASAIREAGWWPSSSAASRRSAEASRIRGVGRRVGPLETGGWWTHRTAPKVGSRDNRRRSRDRRTVRAPTAARGPAHRALHGLVETKPDHRTASGATDTIALPQALAVPVIGNRSRSRRARNVAHPPAKPRKTASTAELAAAAVVDQRSKPGAAASAARFWSFEAAGR